MPAPSKVMRRAAAIAEHHPEKLYARNRGLLKMSKKQLHDFASTKEKSIKGGIAPSRRAYEAMKRKKRR